MKISQLFIIFLFNLVTIFSLNICAEPDDLPYMVEKTHKAVVNISTLQKIKTSGNGLYNQSFGKSELFDIFRHFFDFPEIERDVVSLGSGFLIDTHGTLVTNYHVVKNAVEINIKFHDNKTARAKIIGKDQRTDIAVLKIENYENLEEPDLLIFGDSDEIKIGSRVLAIGNPFGLGNSVTAGIISARSRDINIGSCNDFLQTDAAMNSGNSGGPLLNMKGEVIGVNTAIASTSGSNAGVGFAIPSNLVKNIANKLIENGVIERGVMGIKVQNITKEISDSLGGKKGVLVVEINETSPAEKVGMKIGDLITTFNDNNIKDINSLHKNVFYHDLEKEAKVTVWRNAKEINLFMLLAKQHDDEIDNGKEFKNCPDSSAELLEGICFKDIGKISNFIKERFQINSKDGVIVYHVFDDNITRKFNIRVGDTVKKIIYNNVSSTSEMKTIIDQLKHRGDNSISMLINRKGDNFFIGMLLK